MKSVLALLSAGLVLAACTGQENPFEVRDMKTPRLPAARAATEQVGHENCPHTGSGAKAACCPEESASPKAGPTASAVTWEAPPEWNQGPDKPLRVASFTTGADNRTECYVTVLAGNGGGVDANINRWRMQMGQLPLESDDIEALSRIGVLGHRAFLVEMAGDYTDMAGNKHRNYGLLGAVVTLPTQAVFIKMTGPKEEVLAERPRFVAFCESLNMET